MSFKKTLTITKRVSDYTVGTVSTRVQAENEVLGDFVTWLLSVAPGLSIQEKVEIGSTRWMGQPFLVPSGSSGASDINKSGSCTDLYFLGRGRNKKVIGICIDEHVLRVGLTDTPSRDLDFPASNNNYARLPAAVLRASGYTDYRLNYGAVAELATFGTSGDEVTLNLAYWRGASALVIIGATVPLVITQKPYTCLYTAPNNTVGLHFSLDDDFLISDATYSFSADNTNYASNRDLDYGMSYAPFFARASNYGAFERPVARDYFPTSILCHRLALRDGDVNGPDSLQNSPLQGTDSMASTGALPACTPYGFPRIGNSELYIRKMYVPMTRPAVASPVKIGYTPGQIQQGAVYSVKGKYYVALKTGIISYFVEVADQG
jgi:hypothetical protein